MITTRRSSGRLVPEGWQPDHDCPACRWHLENFDREDLYLFSNPWKGGSDCVNQVPEAETKEEKRRRLLQAQP